MANVSDSDFDGQYVSLLAEINQSYLQLEADSQPFGYNKRQALHPINVRLVCNEAKLGDSEARNAGVLLLSILRGILLNRTLFMATSSQEFLDDPGYLKRQRDEGTIPFPSSLATRDGMQSAVKKLCTFGYLSEINKGFYSTGPKTVSPAPKLLEALKSLDLSRVLILIAKLALNVIIIKGKSGRFVNPNNSDLHREKTKELERTNAYLAEHRFSYLGPSQSFSGMECGGEGENTTHSSVRDVENSFFPHYRRIFKNISDMANRDFYHLTGRGELQCEGRLACAQTHALLKEQRKTIKIDGQCTIEVDISACFPNIAFHLLLKEPPSSLYSADFTNLCENEPGSDKSNAVKLLFQYALNTHCSTQSTRERHLGKLRGAISAAIVSADSEGKSKPKNDPIRLSVTFKESERQKVANELTDVFLRKFDSLTENWICRASWLRLQNIESQMAMYLHLAGVQENVPLISVHDSFIVPETQQSWLEENLVSCYRLAIADELRIPVAKLPDFVRPTFKIIR